MLEFYLEEQARSVGSRNPEIQRKRRAEPSRGASGPRGRLLEADGSRKCRQEQRRRRTATAATWWWSPSSRLRGRAELRRWQLNDEEERAREQELRRDAAFLGIAIRSAERYLRERKRETAGQREPKQPLKTRPPATPSQPTSRPAAAQQGRTAEVPLQRRAQASAHPTAQPPATSAAQPPATPAAQPPATSAAQPPATPAAQPPATPAAQPPATPAAQPAATPAARPTAETVRRSQMEQQRNRRAAAEARREEERRREEGRERRHPEPPPQPQSTQQPTPPQSPPPKSPPPNAPTQQSSSRQEEAPKEPPQEEAQRPQWGGPETAVCGSFVSQNVHTAVRNGMIWHHQVIHITWASGPAPSEAQEERKVWEEEPAPRSNARDPRQHRRQAEAMRAEETASEEREPAAAKAPAATATEAPTAAATEGAAATEEAAAPATATATEIPTSLSQDLYLGCEEWSFLTGEPNMGMRVCLRYEPVEGVGNGGARKERRSRQARNGGSGPAAVQRMSMYGHEIAPPARWLVVRKSGEEADGSGPAHVHVWT
ncbi:fibrous sheath CABYR-binding protein-like [Drosophila obscura]|uniref:fibrous sheath CABYR-binding protein-like n=1 Tax=Drosophila obscura TaxID=7282 RepID=UPI001BB150FC|nr:fibrous sheath CABYR-binding protein-like [Drosophila obscura]